MDLGETPRYNDLYTIFVIVLIRISRHFFTSHVAIVSIAQKALYDLFSNCLISDSVKGLNISIVMCRTLLPMAYPVIGCWNGTHYVYLNF